MRVNTILSLVRSVAHFLLQSREPILHLKAEAKSQNRACRLVLHDKLSMFPFSPLHTPYQAGNEKQHSIVWEGFLLSCDSTLQVHHHTLD